MTTINGIGTKLYGKKKIASDGSYQAIKWFVFIYMPIFPLKTYRVLEMQSFSSLNQEKDKAIEYKMFPINFDIIQALRTFTTFWIGLILVLTILFILVIYKLYYPLLYIVIAFGICYMIYDIFIKSKK